MLCFGSPTTKRAPGRGTELSHSGGRSGARWSPPSSAASPGSLPSRSTISACSGSYPGTRRRAGDGIAPRGPCGREGSDAAALRRGPRGPGNRADRRGGRCAAKSRAAWSASRTAKAYRCAYQLPSTRLAGVSPDAELVHPVTEILRHLLVLPSLLHDGVARRPRLAKLGKRIVEIRGGSPNP